MKAIFFLIAGVLTALITFGCGDSSAPSSTKHTMVFDVLKSPVGANLYDVEFLDDKTGFIVGDSGTVLKTTDWGISWSRIGTGINNCLFCIKIKSKDRLLIGGSGILMTSTNGGFTWDRMIVVGYINDIEFFTDLTGYAVGGTIWAETSKPIIYRTDNAGKAWKFINYSGRFGSIGSLYSLSIIDEFTGLITWVEWGEWGNFTRIYKTTDAGISYRVVYDTNTVYPLSLNYLKPNLICGFIMSTFIYSTDKGESWSLHNSNLNINWRSISCSSEFSYYACGDSGMVASTRDGGYNWEKHYTGTGKRLNSICFPTETFGIAVGSGGTIVRIISM